MAMGMMGFLIIHAKKPARRIDRDFALMLQEWRIEPGTSKPNPLIMTDFNIFTFNHRAFPGTEHLVVKTGDRVRIRLANLSMDSHPIHIHGHFFHITGTDGGPIQESAWVPEVTVNVPVGATRDIEFVADNPGDWAFHCHKSHHTMNAMAHDIPNMMGVQRDKAHEKKIRKQLPNYMEMGNEGMGEMAEMEMSRPKNTLPMMTGEGPFGPIEMGGMFTVLKVRDKLKGYADPGWYKYPKGSVASKVND
jgi:FtsP/CotA-like multicopper oxidase with cupredoxin domain